MGRPDEADSLPFMIPEGGGENRNASKREVLYTEKCLNTWMLDMRSTSALMLQNVKRIPRKESPTGHYSVYYVDVYAFLSNNRKTKVASNCRPTLSRLSRSSVRLHFYSAKARTEELCYVLSLVLLGLQW